MPVTAIVAETGEKVKIVSVHPVADLFPLFSTDEMIDLADDITERGQLFPVTVTADGVLLDGRNRLAACGAAKVEPLAAIGEGVGGDVQDPEHQRAPEPDKIARQTRRLRGLRVARGLRCPRRRRRRGSHHRRLAGHDERHRLRARRRSRRRAARQRPRCLMIVDMLPPLRAPDVQNACTVPCI